MLGIHRRRWIPRPKASNAENVSIWWRHHVIDENESLWEKWANIILWNHNINQVFHQLICTQVIFEKYVFSCFGIDSMLNRPLVSPVFSLQPSITMRLCLEEILWSVFSFKLIYTSRIITGFNTVPSLNTVLYKASVIGTWQTAKYMKWIFFLEFSAPILWKSGWKYNMNYFFTRKFLT